jgi:hypothetical protein
MMNLYFTFLYNECKRLCNANIDINQIKDFINSPEGQRGLRIFCAQNKQKHEFSRPKKAAELLSGFEHE